jgi:transposase
MSVSFLGTEPHVGGTGLQHQNLVLTKMAMSLDHAAWREIFSAEPHLVRAAILAIDIGPFIAIVLILELGDIRRFPTAKHLASYIGLTPRVRAGADRLRTGHISKEGNRLLRWVLVTAATQAARRPGPLRA